MKIYDNIKMPENKELLPILSKHQLKRSYDFQIYLTCCGCMAADFAKGYNKEKL